MIISFDFWGTIANSNPQFKKEQLNLAKNNKTWYKVKKELTKDWEKRFIDYKDLKGEYPSQRDFYKGLFLEKEGIDNFINQTNLLFSKYPPMVIDSTLINLKKLIKYRDQNPSKEIKIGIVSNTFSINGNEIREFLFSNLGLRLDFYNFSDAMKIAKPNPKIFKTRDGMVKIHFGNDPLFDNAPGVHFVNVTKSGYSSFVDELTSSKKDNSAIKEFKYSKHTFSDPDDTTFNIRDYSKLKYGSGLIAKEFGYSLAKGLYHSLEFDRFIKSSAGKEIVIASAPYKYIPVAATALKNEVVKKLNILLSREVKNPVVDLKVFRGHSYNLDYGALTAKERDAALSSDSFHIDSEFIKGKSLILVDDVRITGSHEKRMRSLLDRIGYKGEVLYLYYAEFLGSGDPSVENILNFASIDMGLLSISSLVKNENFIFNTRVTKYILGSGDEEFKVFISEVDQDFKETLYCCAAGNKYLEIPEFKKNLNYLKTFL